MGCGNVVRLAFEYDAKIVILLLTVCFEWINPKLLQLLQQKMMWDWSLKKICLEWDLN